MTLTENCAGKYNEEMFHFYVLLTAAAFLIQNWSRFVTDVTTACKVFGLCLLFSLRKSGIHCLFFVQINL